MPDGQVPGGQKPIKRARASRKQLFLIIAIIAVLVAAGAFFVIFFRPANWASVASWNGQQTETSVTTEPFTINGTQWRVNWQVSSYDNSSRCYVSVFNADTNQLIVELPHDQQSGEANFITKGAFYLKIELHGALQSWSVQVSQTA